MGKKLILAVALILLGASLAFAAPKKRLVAAMDCTWPPMEFLDDEQKIAGYTIDYVNALAEVIGIEIVCRNVAWDGIFAGLLAKRYDFVASSVTITEERKASMSFSTPYYRVRQAVITPKDSTIKSVADLDGLTLGAQIDTTGLFAIERIRGAKARSYSEISQAIEAALAGRIDGAVCDDPIAANFVLQNKAYASRIKIAFVIPAEEDEFYGFAVRKENRALLELLNRGIAELQKNGTEARLRRKWIGQ